ncbi:MAG: response regulator transcription factor [Clostridiales bacterium]|nr:response regulator transcription factor [Clostridiales bacterium]
MLYLMNNILFVEDDAIIASGLRYALESEGYTVTHCDSAADAKDVIAGGQTFDLALLDIGLPDGNGFDVLKKLRARGDTPAIFLTAVEDEANTVLGFDLGADDYVTKPFRLRELISRVKAVLRRREGGTAETLTLGPVQINTRTAKVAQNGEDVELTALEYKLLLTFASNKGRILTRAQLLESLWDTGGNYVTDNTLTVYVKRLREKLHDEDLIETVRGVGYRA